MIGILFGLYCHISIALFVMFLFFSCIWFIIKHKNLKRYDTVLDLKKAIILFSVCILLSCIFTNIKNNQYENKNKQMEEEETYTGIISSNPTIKEYHTQYKVTITKVGNKSSNIIVYLRIKGRSQFEYGDEIAFQGEYSEPDEARNDKGFNYKKYLRSNGIIGIVKTNKVEKIDINKGKALEKIACKTQNIIEETIQKNISKKEHQGVLLGILLGNDNQIEQGIKENFVNSSLSHILAVSGMHVAYMIAIVDYVLSTLKVGKKQTKAIMIFFLIFFTSLANHTPSVRRACMMAGLGILAGLIYQKSDILNNMAISILIILLQNPFSLWNTGLLLSYSATLGIVLLTPIFLSKKETEERNRYKRFWKQKIKPIIVVSISSWIAIFPINMALFNTISFTFVFSNLMVSAIIGVIIMLGMVASIPVHIPILSNIIFLILDFLLCILIKISQLFSSMPLSSVLVCRPNIGILILYYSILIFCIYQKKLKRKRGKKKNTKTIINKCG